MSKEGITNDLNILPPEVEKWVKFHPLMKEEEKIIG